MRNLLKVFKWFGYITSFVYTRRIQLFFNEVCDNYYTGLISRQFLLCHGIFKGYIDLIGGEYIKIGLNTVIHKNVRLWAWSKFNNCEYSPSIIIGKKTSIGSGCMISCINSVCIGDYVGIAANCVIVDNTHGDFREHKFSFNNNPDIPDVFLQNVFERALYSKGGVIIEDNVHLGEGVIVMPGVLIGHNSVIAAHSVVSKNIPPYSIVAGDPAMVVLTFGKKGKQHQQTYK